jgi:hypothetical protein
MHLFIKWLSITQLNLIKSKLFDIDQYAHKIIRVAALFEDVIC